MMMDHQHNGRHDQKNFGDDNDPQILLDQDREQIDANESLQLRGDDPVSELYIWGNDYYGQLGVGSDKVIHNLPKVCSFNIVVTDVSCGEEHTVFVQGDGGYVYAMGSNSEGRLGTGNPEMRSCNVPTLVDGLCNIRKVSCGTSHTLALSDDGQAYAWGQAFYGALGMRPNDQGGLENVFAPKVIPQESFGNDELKDLEAGSRHSIFVTNQNMIYGCGDANQGQLGLGDANRDRVTEPTQIMTNLQGMSIHMVSCGKYHTLLLTNNPKEGNRRELWACGANNFGQIGNNSNQNQFTPVRVDPRQPEDKMSQNCRSHRFKQVSTWHASAAVTEEGIMYVWGAGIFGEFKRPRKVKLQNNIRVNSVHVGGSFVVIVDQNNKIVVWGSNSNGEIGVGDSKVRNHPTRLETIEDKIINKISVGGSFAFAIGKTTSRMDNSIFDDGAATANENERSHISGIGRNGTSNIMMEDMKEPDHERNNRSINSLEEQLQQIALSSGSKPKRQDSDDHRSQKPQDRSVGNHSHNAMIGKFEQAANRVSLMSNSGKQGASAAGAGSENNAGGADENKQLYEQVAYYKQIIEEKERMIKNLNEQSQQKHEDYQDKLHRFKEMQDQELQMSNKLREENTKLRSENDALRDETIDLKRQISDFKRSERPLIGGGAERPASPYLAPGRQESGSSATQQKTSESNNAAPKPNYFPGVNSSLPSSTSQFQQRDYQQQPSSHVQPSSSSYEQQPSSTSAFAKYDHYQSNWRGSVDTAGGQSPQPQKLGMDDLNNRDSSTLNDDRFQQTYLRNDHSNNNAPQTSTNSTVAYGGGTYQQNTAQTSSYNYGREEPGSTYQRYHQPAGRPGASGGGYGGQLDDKDNLYNQQNERVSVDVDNLDRSPDSTAKKHHDFHLNNQGASHLLASRELRDEFNQNMEHNHMRRASQINNQGVGQQESTTFRGVVDKNSSATMSSNFAQRTTGLGGIEDHSNQPRYNAGGASAYSRERVNSGRVENLRSMGADLMRPASQDGATSNAMRGVGAPTEESSQSKMRNSSSGFYQPSNKYTRLNDFNRSSNEDYHQQQRRDTDEGGIGAYERGTFNNSTNLPDASEIQNRLKTATRFSQENNKSSPNDPAKRSMTPNASNSYPQSSYEPLGQNRVSYKPNNNYERLTTGQQQETKDSTSQGGGANYGYKPPTVNRFNEQHLPGKTDFVNPSSSMPNSSQKDPFMKQRPGSGNGRDPLYQTHNNFSSSIKYDNLMGTSGVSNSDGFASKYYGGGGGQQQDQLFNRGGGGGGSQNEKNGNSPSKPPRSDLYRPSGTMQEGQKDDQYVSSQYTAHGGVGAGTKYAFTPTANRSTSDMATTQNDGAGAGRPPPYKAGDYQTRYSYDPPAATSAKDGGVLNNKGYEGGQGSSATNATVTGGSYRLAAGAAGIKSSNTTMGAGLQTQPGSHQHSYSRENYNNNEQQQQQQMMSSSTNHQQQFEMSGKLTMNSRLPERTSSFSAGYGAGGGGNNNHLDKGRSPFTAQQLNDQQPVHQSEYTKLGSSSYTPQGSGRRSGSLIEQSNDMGGGGDGGEDIRSKLARYKKEREDFEVIRQQFRKKNSELGASTTTNSAGVNANGGTNASVYSENIPNTGGGSKYSHLGVDNGSSNIFAATEHSSSQVHNFQAHAVTGGSPAFGQPEQNHSRDQ